MGKKAKKQKVSHEQIMEDVYKDQKPELVFKSTDVNVREIQNLLLWILSDYVSNPNWVFVKNKPLISKILFVMVNGMDASSLREHTDIFTRLREKCMDEVSVKGPGNNNSVYSPTKALFDRQVKTNKEKTSPMKNMQAIDFVHSIDSLVYQGYPMPSEWIDAKEDTASFTCSPSAPFIPIIKLHPQKVKKMEKSGESVGMSIVNELPFQASEQFLCTQYQTPNLDKNSSYLNMKGNIFGLDCEMVETLDGSDLARCTVVDRDGKAVYDEYVKPKSTIKDYLTRYSGISASDLKDVTKEWEEVRQEVMNIVHGEDILVGHSLENDLTVLRLCHRRVLDTSLLYTRKEGPEYKYSLAALSRRFLKREMKRDVEHGHSSAEDARTALNLAKLKIRSGPSFGVSSDTISFFDILAKAEDQSQIYLLDSPFSLLMHAVNLGNANVITCKSDEEALENTLRTIEKSKSKEGEKKSASLNTFIYVAYNGIDKAQSETEREEAFKNCADSLIRLHGAIEPNTLMITMFSNPNIDHIRAMSTKKMTIIDNLYAQMKEGEATSTEIEQWSVAQERKLCAAVSKARQHACLLSLKQV